MDSYSILFVDDDAIVEYLVTTMCEKSEHTINLQTFNTVPSAINITEIIEFDIILVDMQISIHDGWEYLEYLDSINTKSHVYLLSNTATSIKNSDDRYSDLIKDYIDKPLTIDILNQMIDELKESKY